MLMRCDRCNGRKTVMKIGMMIGQCDHCNGTGTLEKPEVKTDFIKEVIEKKRPLNEDIISEPLEKNISEIEPQTKDIKSYDKKKKGK